jgi:hypothetical protein
MSSKLRWLILLALLSAVVVWGYANSRSNQTETTSGDAVALGDTPMPGDQPAPIATQAPSETLVPSGTPAPSDTPALNDAFEPSDTPLPTDAPGPTRMSQPVERPTPTTANMRTATPNVSVERSFDIVTLLPQDAIQAIFDPQFLTVAEADQWYDAEELVLGVEIDGEARAYSIPFLSGHEIVNDTVGGRKIAVTW